MPADDDRKFVIEQFGRINAATDTKLKPRRYKPKFVYDRITDGFRKMPAWKEQYSDLERMQIVAYIMSDQFSP